ncbi:MAG: M14 family zinc carboxypeptidase [bacterium]|nr:M14 family zinc carboxypeptidase [bacterium]
MKSFIKMSCVICALSLFSLAWAQDRGVYRVPRQAREALMQMQATVRHGSLGGDFVAELTPQQAESLRQSGFGIEMLFASTKAEDAALRSQDGFDEFHSYDQMRSSFISYAASHPNIAQYVILGHSVQNRELFALKISDNPLVEENEPELAFWGNIHGNEYAGGELPYMYALYLCDNYGIIPAVTQYVNNNEIWCIPLINPDGRVLGQRDNVNGIDLNRDFGYEWYGQGSSPSPFSQIETRTVLEFCLQHNITLSTTFHCSGDVVFYPWGYAPQNVPDLGIINRLVSRYASVAAYAFGNSWEDYETHGELLDDLYGRQGGICLTVEVSNSSTNINQTYSRNQSGMNLFCNLAGEGLHGVVTDAQTGDPLWAAVWIAGDPIPAYTDPEVGDLHRLVTPGTYNLTVWANGYIPQTINGVTVAVGSPGQFQASLQPGGSESAFMVTSVNQRDPNNAHANVTYPSYALGAPDGKPCSLGASGFIVLDMGLGHEIVNGAGNDFTVTEAIFPRDPNPESYRVYAGDAYTQNALIGTATGTASFDLGSAGVTSTRYLKILDNSGASPNLPYAGMDLDGITVLNSDALAILEPSGPAPVPSEIGLSVFPNPFNPTTTFSFELRAASFVTLEVFDVNGRTVGAHGMRPIVGGVGSQGARHAPLQETWYPAGSHEITFDGSGLPSGVYLYRLTAGENIANGKMVLMK